MLYTNLISTADLAANLDNPNWVIIDCRFALNDTEAGRTAYEASHIPGARYAHLDEDLSGLIVPGKTGRHPLPTIEEFVETLSSWGIHNRSQVVAYDHAGGLMAGRLWWMLRAMGHDAVAVLDGDWRLWQQEGHPVSDADIAPQWHEFVPQWHEFVPQPRPEMEASVEEIMADLESGTSLLCDARDPARYRGEANALDPVSGHIPGARSAYFGGNLAEDGKWLPPEALQERYDQLLEGRDPNEVIFYCGFCLGLYPHGAC